MLASIQEKFNEFFEEKPSANVPVCIVGSDGPETNLLYNILERAGIAFNSPLNDHQNTQHFESFLDEYVNRVIQYTRTLDYIIADIPSPLAKDIVDELERCYQACKDDLSIQAGLWGIKSQRMMYMLPFLSYVSNQCYVIHMTRDGREIAFSDHHQDVKKHYRSLFGKVYEKEDVHSAAIELWSHTNISASVWAKRHLENRYIHVRFSDLCREPKKTLQQIFALLQFKPQKPYDELTNLITQPQANNAWQLQPAAQLNDLLSKGRAGLKEFGYL